MAEYITIGIRLQNFEIYHINEEIRHLKCHLHCGSCTQIPYLHIFENQRKLHQSPQIFFLEVREMCDNRIRVQLADVRIYKRKQESKKERKHALDQETDQESDQEKKIFFLFFLVTFLVESVFSFCLFFFLIDFLVEGVFSCFIL